MGESCHAFCRDGRHHAFCRKHAPERTPLDDDRVKLIHHSCERKYVQSHRGEDGKIPCPYCHIAALEQALAEAKERRSEAERMGETWLRQRQPDKYGPTKPEGEE